MDLTELLAFVVKNKASDLHLSSGLPPMIRVHGDVRRINVPPMEHKEVHAMIYDIMSDGQRKFYEENLARLLVRGAQPRALPRKRFRAAARRGGGDAHDPVQDPVARGPQGAEDLRRDRRPAARPRAGHRADRLGQEHHARRHGQPHQRERVRPHPHHRGPDRVRARVEEVPHQPARGRAAHALVRQRAAQRAARGPGRDPGRRDARPGDHPAGAHRRRDRPPGVRHAAHLVGGEDHRPHRRRLPGGGEGDGARDALGVDPRGDLADAAQDQGRLGPRRGARDHDRHPGDPQPDPREQDRADVLGDPDRPPDRHADLDQNLQELVQRNIVSGSGARTRRQTRTISPVRHAGLFQRRIAACE